MEEFLDVYADATILTLSKGEGGWTVIGKVWEKEENSDDPDDPTYLCRLRLHICTSETEVIKRVKHYMRKGLEMENGITGD